MLLSFHDILPLRRHIFGHELFFLQVLFEGLVVVQPGSTKLHTVLLDLLHRWTLLAEAIVVLVSLQ